MIPSELSASDRPELFGIVCNIKLIIEEVNIPRTPSRLYLTHHHHVRATDSVNI